MNTVIEMARESWLDTYGLGKDHISFVEALERFAELVRIDAMKAVEQLERQGIWITREEAINVIRNRSNT